MEKFGIWAKRGSWRHNPKEICALTLWDAIRVGKCDISNESLEIRRENLESILSKAETPNIQTTAILNPVESIAREIEQQALTFRNNAQSRSGFVHGVVLKRRGSPRRDNAVRCREHADWIKIVFSGMGSGL
jgi:ATP-dependent DNA ligase